MISTWVLVWTIFCAVIVYITNWLESKPSLKHCRINLCNTLLSHSLWYFSSSNWLAMIPFHSAASTSSQFSCVLNCQLFTQVITVAVILCKYSRWKNCCWHWWLFIDSNNLNANFAQCHWQLVAWMVCLVSLFKTHAPRMAMMQLQASLEKQPTERQWISFKPEWLESSSKTEG